MQSKQHFCTRVQNLHICKFAHVCKLCPCESSFKGLWPILASKFRKILNTLLSQTFTNMNQIHPGVWKYGGAQKCYTTHRRPDGRTVLLIVYRFKYCTTQGPTQIQYTKKYIWLNLLREVWCWSSRGVVLKT